MKLLLTSGGIRNSAIAKALGEMVGKPASETGVAFIPTAANVEAGNKDWYINQLLCLWRFGYCNIDIVDPSAANVSDWQERLAASDVIFVSGGNSFHLLEQARASGLADWLKQNLGERVYVGSSAGTLLAQPTIAIAGVENADRNLTGLKDLTGLGLADIEVFPHAFRYFSEEVMQAYADKSAYPVYGADDTSAIQVIDDKPTIITEVYCKLFTKSVAQ